MLVQLGRWRSPSGHGADLCAPGQGRPRAALHPPHRRYRQPVAAEKSLAAAANAAATRSVPSRGGMPLGARVSQPAPANESHYVDLE